MASWGFDAQDLRTGGTVMLAVAFASPLFGSGRYILCPLRALTGVPCPLCGMTTSVTSLVHGDVSAAISANPIGLLAVATAVWLLIDRRRESVSVPWLIVGAGVLTSWFWQLNRYGWI